MNAETHLFDVVDTLGAAGGLASGLDRRQQQADQHADDRDDHQQLNEREASHSTRSSVSLHRWNLPWVDRDVNESREEMENTARA